MRNLTKKFLVCALAPVIWGGACFFPLQSQTVSAKGRANGKERFSYGVEIDGFSLGGVKRERGLKMLRENVERHTPVLTIQTPKGEYSYAYPEIGFTDNYDELFQTVKKGSYTGEITWHLKGQEEKLQRIADDNGVKTLDAAVYFSKDGFTYFPERTGIVCDKGTLEEDIRKALSSTTRVGEKSGFEKVTLKTRKNAPSQTVETLKKRTVKLASYTTYFSEEDKGRCENIKLAARLLDGQTLFAYQEFSFNQTVGERTKKRGFKEAKIIENGQFIKGTGGGVCQVSTTIYNAALLSGLTVTKRAPHSLAVSYVEPSRDAMVSSHSDLRFQNPFSIPVYLSVKTGWGWITATFYGKDNGLTYRVKSKILGEITPPEPEVKYGDEEGELKKEKAGVKSEGYLYVYQNGTLLSIKRLSCDSYAPVRGIIGKKI